MRSLGTLRSLVLNGSSKLLESLQLHSCTALERLEIGWCSSLVTLEGLQSLVNLKHLKIRQSPAAYLSLLNTSFCKGLTCLRSLMLTLSDATRLTDEQESALQLLRSLQELHFEYCAYLVDLPAGLHGLLSLKTLKIVGCGRISGLPKEGLPPSLEELEIFNCSAELSKQCRLLGTSKLEVKIDWVYVD
ncbi:hypothetical protein VPH35_113956 [Triticum aestivum]